MKTSYFKIDRGIQYHWLWEDKPFSRGQAWIDIILMATHTDKKTFYRGQLINRTRGEVYTSMDFLATRWGWSKNKVKRFLRTLEEDKMITTKGSTHGTVLNIEKYTFYQGEYSTKGSTKSTTKGPANEPPGEPPNGPTDGPANEPPGEPPNGPQTKKINKDIKKINKGQKGTKSIQALREEIKKNNDAWKKEQEEKR